MYYGGALYLLLRASHLHLSDGAFVSASRMFDFAIDHIKSARCDYLIQ
jgi:hypothetical protein